MRCLALRHIACEDLAGFAPILADRFHAVDLLDMDGAGALAALEEAAGADLVIALGGPMGVYEAGRYPFIQREIELLGQRIRSGRPTLGICLGSQIMAAAAGARVYHGGRQEVGWYPITFDPAAAADPVLGRLAAGSGVFFHWHGDTFDLPAGSRALGGSERFARQGFAIGRHAVALQFHAEITPEALDGWLKEYERGLKPGPGVMSAAELRAGARAHGASLAARGRAFLNAWLDELFQ
jgi:GMP synthase (glutamine-hydrolysing)